MTRQEAADRHHLTGGEINHAGRLVHHDEGKAHQRVDRADSEAADDELDQLLQGYSASYLHTSSGSPVIALDHSLSRPR